jgi:hypothetical protein
MHEEKDTQLMTQTEKSIRSSMEVRMKGMRFAMVLFLSLSMFLCASGVWAAESTIKPVQNIGAWLIGFHADKENPSRQWVAHHFCHQLRPDLMQCVLYEDNSPDAKMTGIEYPSRVRHLISFRKTNSTIGIRTILKYSQGN